MSTVYISSNNGILSDKEDILYYEDYKGNKVKLLPDKIKQLVLIGRTTITSGAFSLLFANHIEVAFLNKNGKYSGRLAYSDKKNTLIRHLQHEVYDDKERSLSIAKDIVRGKLHNQYLFLQRIGRKTGDPCKRIKNTLRDFTRVRQFLECASSIEEVRGFEGDGSKLYFSCFGMNINSGWATFNGRSKNPPLDPVNSVLSFLYTVLANRIGSYVSRSGLDSGIGNLHALSYGRDSLIFDLIEEFRTPLVDTLTCALFNMYILKKDHFRIETVNEIYEDEKMLEQISDGGRDAVLLNEDGCKRVLDQFEKKLSETHFYPYLGRVLTYEKIIDEQVKLYKQVIGGMLDHYLPLIVT